MDNSYQNITELLEEETIHEFHPRFENQTAGPHSNGHLAVGALQVDHFSSPGDLVFWMHHGMVDRV